ncbi:MAG: hypothetical protein FWE98_07735 [Oscillospiraceae bacterium]|nr:hypothetical protein [Oscillospiraceae bacterium]
MALFDRSGRRSRPETRRLPGSRDVEIAREFPAGAPYEELGSIFDPWGSYTGVAADGGNPVQDADDL